MFIYFWRASFGAPVTACNKMYSLDALSLSQGVSLNQPEVLLSTKLPYLQFWLRYYMDTTIM
jgi:hypothetical protein